MLFKHTLLYFPAQFLAPFAQLAAVIVWSHWLSPEDYGDLTFVIAAQELVYLLCLYWWSLFTVRHMHAEASASFCNAEVPVLMVISLAQGVVTVLALLLITTPLTLPLAMSSVLYAVTRSLCVHLGERARAENRIFTYSVAQTTGPVIGFAVAFYGLSSIAPKPEMALVGYSLVQLLTLAWLVRHLGITLGSGPPDKALIRKALHFGLPLIAAGAIAWIGLNTIRVAVDRSSGGAAMGLIAVGWGLGQRLTATVSMFVTVAAFPLAVQSLRAGGRDQALRYIATNGLVMFSLLLPTSIGFVLLSPPLIKLFVAAPFQEVTMAVLPFAVAAGMARNMRVHIIDQIYVLVEATRTVLFINIVEAIAVVAGCFIGLEWHGPVGAAAGCCGGYVFVMILGFVATQMRIGWHPSYADVASILLAAAAMTLVLVVPPWERIANGPVMQVTIEMLAGGLVYGMVIIASFPALLRGTGLSGLRAP